MESSKITKLQKIKERSVSRLYAVQALFQIEANNNSVEKIVLEFKNHREKENLDSKLSPQEERLLIDFQLSRAVDLIKGLSIYKESLIE